MTVFQKLDSLEGEIPDSEGHPYLEGADVDDQLSGKSRGESPDS